MWQPLSEIGRSESGGYVRHGWTAADRACRDWFAGCAARRGLAVEEDSAANLWAWWPAPGGGAVVTGSHLDSVPEGGAYDGPLGVVAGFLAVDLLRERGVRPERPIAVVAFAEEEGARFGVACLGSRVLTGVLDNPDNLVDPDGVRLLDAAGPLRPDPQALGRVGVFVELHIEQGRALADLGAPLALADGIWPHGRWRFDFAGEANHAGTTRLPDRADPMLPFARTVLAARAAAERHGGLATIGRVAVVPNGTNAVASTVTAWLDARAPAEESLDALVAEVAAGADATVTAESVSARVDFDPSLRARIAAVLGRRVPVLGTGAGHDAGVLSAVVPTAMLFVRNPTGVSHAPAEAASDADCAAGVEALAAVLADLSGA
jgi:N-carbamoyl-L-amino-acid hydrolase